MRKEEGRQQVQAHGVGFSFMCNGFVNDLFVSVFVYELCMIVIFK